MTNFRMSLTRLNLNNGIRARDTTNRIGTNVTPRSNRTITLTIIRMSNVLPPRLIRQTRGRPKPTTNALINTVPSDNIHTNDIHIPRLLTRRVPRRRRHARSHRRSARRNRRQRPISRQFYILNNLLNINSSLVNEGSLNTLRQFKQGRNRRPISRLRSTIRRPDRALRRGIIRGRLRRQRSPTGMGNEHDHLYANGRGATTRRRQPYTRHHRRTTKGRRVTQPNKSFQILPNNTIRPRRGRHYHHHGKRNHQGRHINIPRRRYRYGRKPCPTRPTRTLNLPRQQGNGVTNMYRRRQVSYHQRMTRLIHPYERRRRHHHTRNHGDNTSKTTTLGTKNRAGTRNEPSRRRQRKYPARTNNGGTHGNVMGTRVAYRTRNVWGRRTPTSPI